MSRIHIDKLEVTGTKGTSSIEFAENLTIIMGKSETGKTAIYKCIDYLFGAKDDVNHRPFLLSTGYDTITGYFTTDNGSLTLTRKIDSKTISVETTISGIDTEKPYHCSTSNKRWIGYLWQQILGVPDHFKIPYSKDGKMKSFSWRSINQALMIHEKRSQSTTSIIMAKDKTNETAFLSELLYILYTQDLTEYDAEEGTKLRKIRRAAVQKYILSKRDAIKARLSSLTEKQPEKIDINQAVEELKKRLEEISKMLQKAVTENQEVSKEIIGYQEQQNKLQITLQRFKILESQYAADIKRLGLIVDGEIVRETSPRPQKCPFCDGQIVSHKHTSYIEASRGELTKTINNANELNEAKQDVLEELAFYSEKLTAAEKKKADIEKMMNEKLLPEQTALEKQLQDYQVLIEYNKTLTLFQEMDSTFDTDFKNNDKTADTVDYHPKELLKEHDDFAILLEENYRKILRAVSFKPVDTVEFDFASFDITVNHNPKPNRSKGYTAILNSILVLALREYINANAAINPHFYFLDSPLHGLMTEANDENSEDDLRKGFFKYIFENYGDDQIIIIENTDKHELPIYDYDPSKVKVYEFTKSKDRGRYGFLREVYQN